MKIQIRNNNKNLNTRFINIIQILFIVYLLHKIIKNKKYQISNFKNLEERHIVTQILIESCKKINLKYTLLDTNIIKITHNNKSIIFDRLYNNIYSKEDKIRIGNKKYVTNKLLNNNIKAPRTLGEFGPIKSLNLINNIVNKISEYPVVVKPIDSTGGIKVFVNIKDKEHLRSILINKFLNKKILRSKSNKILIETYLVGNDYRILCYNDKILEVYIKKPIIAIGNGINSIEELIRIKNSNVNKNHTNIIISDELLKSQNVNRKTILKKGEKININIATRTNGSEHKRIPLKNIHPDNIKMFKKVNKILNTSLIGIDFIIEDMSKSYKTQNCGINEVNTSPNFTPLAIINPENKLKIPIQFLKLYFNL